MQMYLVVLLVASLVVPSVSFTMQPPARRPRLLRLPSSPLMPDSTTDELKQSLLETAMNFKTAQEKLWAEEDCEAALAAVSQAAQTAERVKPLLGAESFGNVEVGLDASLSALKDRAVELIQALAARNPTQRPLAGWRAADPSVTCALEGTWELVFTTGADATFRPKPGAARPDTYQTIDARAGKFVNCIDFPPSEGAKLKGFRVAIKGVALSDTDMLLKFRRVRLLTTRQWWPRQVVIPLPPSAVLRLTARVASKGKGQPSKRGAGFTILYLDGDLRVHQTFDGQWFVQQRIEPKD